MASNHPEYLLPRCCDVVILLLVPQVQVWVGGKEGYHQFRPRLERDTPPERIGRGRGRGRRRGGSTPSVGLGWREAESLIIKTRDMGEVHTPGQDQGVPPGQDSRYHLADRLCLGRYTSCGHAGGGHSCCLLRLTSKTSDKGIKEIADF